VAIWRVAALLLVYGQADAAEESLIFSALLATLGMVFVAYGLLVLWKIPSKTNLLFAGFCICSGLHWGGPLELPAGPLRVGFILFYVVVSSLLGEVFFLQFALSFLRKSHLAARRFTAWVHPWPRPDEGGGAVGGDAGSSSWEVAGEEWSVWP
jgi:hypothetical protein